MAKLDAIAGGVDEIRVEQRAVRDRLETVERAQIRLEEHMQTHARRLDRLEGKEERP